MIGPQTATIVREASGVGSSRYMKRWPCHTREINSAIGPRPLHTRRKAKISIYRVRENEREKERERKGASNGATIAYR